ncbi:MAG: hypothetical protein ACT4QC_01985 [Planctomycetaceae bacterium]
MRRQLQFPTDPYFRAAVALGLLPLATGIGIFLLWLILRWDWLIFAGILTIYAGVACVAAGFACLVIYIAKTRESRPVTGAATVAAILILLANFPCAWAIAYAAAYVHSMYSVTIVNNSPTTLHDVVLPSTGASFGSIRSGEKRTRQFHVTIEGSLDFHATCDGQRISGNIEGYVTPGMGGSAILIFKPDGTWEIDGSGADRESPRSRTD